MKGKLNCVLLIDDEEADNYYHKKIIEKSGVAETIISVQSGKRALEFLLDQSSGEYPKPDLIFLDINMPGMNGWEFLEAYKALDEERKGKIVLIMLTTSLNPEDMDKAQAQPEINGFRNKPLTIEGMKEIVKTHFPGL